MGQNNPEQAPVVDGSPAIAAPPTEQEPSIEPGDVTWFCSEEEGGPDCGLLLGLGLGVSLYVGEMPASTLADHGFDVAETGDGWWLVLYGYESETKIIGRIVGETYDAQSLVDQLSFSLKVALRDGEAAKREPSSTKEDDAALSLNQESP